MTKDQVAELIESIKEPLSPEDFLVALATKAAEWEREQCAKVCETLLGPTATDFYGKPYAAAIRARSK